MYAYVSVWHLFSFLLLRWQLLQSPITDTVVDLLVTRKEKQLRSAIRVVPYKYSTAIVQQEVLTPANNHTFCDGTAVPSGHALLRIKSDFPSMVTKSDTTGRVTSRTLPFGFVASVY